MNTVFGRLDVPPVAVETAVNGPVSDYPDYEQAVGDAYKLWTGVAEESDQFGRKNMADTALLIAQGLRMPEDENGILPPRLSDHVRMLGALGAALFMRACLVDRNAVMNDLHITPRIDVISMKVLLQRARNPEVMKRLGYSRVPQLTPPESDYALDVEDAACEVALPLTGISPRALEDRAWPLIPFHPTLHFRSVPDAAGETDRHDGWYRSREHRLFVQRVTAVPEVGPRNKTERVLIVPFADTSKIY